MALQAEKSTNRLVFRLYASPIGGLIVIAFAAIFYTVASGELRFHCAVGEDFCTYERTGRFRAQSETIARDDIRRATVEERRSTSESSRGYKYTPVLETAQGTYRLSPYSSNNPRPQERTAQEVNEFLRGSPRADLTIEKAPNALFTALPALFMLIGVFLVVGIRNIVEISANPQTRQLLIERRRWWQSSGKQKSLDIDQIERVEVETKTRVSHSHSHRHHSRTTMTHKCVIVLSSGERVPLFGTASSGRGAFKRKDAIEGLLRSMSAEKLQAGSPSPEQVASGGEPGAPPRG